MLDRVNLRFMHARESSQLKGHDVERIEVISDFTLGLPFNKSYTMVGASCSEFM